MPQDVSNNKRIAKNTLFLYFRTILVMAISLYTSRVVLNALGVEDFGIYSVVGGIVMILGFLNNAMAGATQRFLNFEMGRGNKEGIRNVFSSGIAIHFLIAIVILVLAETVGLWFLNTCMNISESRVVAARWVYQFSLMAFMVTIVSVPYNAAIIAHERMSAFAYVGILEAFLKLSIAIAISYAPFDRLAWYAFLMFMVSVFLRIVYGVYCSRRFDECHFRRGNVDKALVRKMLSFSAWTIFGNLGYILHTQGIAVLINMFFGATVNAAQGIANQVNAAVSHFLHNFLTALNPQIVKSYAAGEIQAMHRLVSRGCRIAFCLVMMMILPLVLETPFILKAWLKIVPDYAVIFVRLVLLLTLFGSFSGVLATAKGATGDIKSYQIALTTIGFFHLPLSWLFFSMGYEPYYAMYVYVVIVIVLQIVRIWFVCRSLQWSIGSFYTNVVLRLVLVGCLSCALPAYLHCSICESIGRIVLVVLTSVLCVGVCSLYAGLNGKERVKVWQFAATKIKTLSHV